MWEAKLHDGRRVSGDTVGWASLDGVTGLGYRHRGVLHSLPDNQSDYVFFNSAHADLSGGRVVVDSRVIGCTLSSGTVIRLRFLEGSGDVIVEFNTGG